VRVFALFCDFHVKEGRFHRPAAAKALTCGGDFSDQFNFNVGLRFEFAVAGFEEGLAAVSGFCFDDDEFGAGNPCVVLSWADMARLMVVVAEPRDLAPLARDAAICTSVRIVPSSWLEVTMPECGFRVGFSVKLLFLGEIFL
jgi:hypothetical protein